MKPKVPGRPDRFCIHEALAAVRDPEARQRWLAHPGATPEKLARVEKALTALIALWEENDS